MPTSILHSSAQSSVSQEVANSAYQAHVNPQWVKLLELLQMNARYVECRGEKLQTEDGRTILDFYPDTAFTTLVIIIRRLSRRCIVSWTGVVPRCCRAM